MVSKNMSLRILDISSNPIDQVGAIALTRALEWNVISKLTIFKADIKEEFVNEFIEKGFL